MSSRKLGITGAFLAVLLLTAGTADHPLLDAVRRGDAEAVRALLQGGADANVAQGDGLTPLHIAAEQGDLEITRLLLDARANVHAASRLGAYTPLHLAAAGAHADIVRALLDAGADPGAATTNNGVTPLHLAARALGGEQAVGALIEAGAPVNARETTTGQTALMFAAGYGRAPAIRQLTSHGADPDLATAVVDVLERVYIDQQARDRMSEAMAWIRAESPDGTDRELTVAEQQRAIAYQREFLRDEEWIEGLLYGFTPDWLATRRPWWSVDGNESTDTIVGRPHQETLVGKTGGMTALHFAAREGRVEAVQALLDGGAGIDPRSGDGSTPLVIALLNGQFDLSMTLIERGADVNLATHTDGVSPLFALIQTQWALRFTNHPQPRAQDQQGTPHTTVLAALLERGADPNVRLRTHLWHLEWEGKFGMDITGATPFWRAAFAQDLEAMKLLAEHGADPKIPTTWPEPGMRENRQEDGRVAEDSGLPVMPEGTPNVWPIHGAAGGGYLGLGAFQQNNVPNNFMNAVKYLVEEHGADVNLPDSWGYTPLHYAAVRGDNALIEYLVSKGGDVTAVTRLGQSVVDMTRGGRNGFFSRTPYPVTEELLLRLGSEYKCLNTHMRNNGDWCAGAGVAPFKGALENTDIVTKF